VSCPLSKEGYAAAIAEEMGLSNANKSPLMTPFHSGLPVDAIPHVDMLPEGCAPLILKMQCWIGMLNWLQPCTHPDLATILSLSGTHMHCPSPGHIEAAKYVGRYILSTMDLGLGFSTKTTSSLESIFPFRILVHMIPTLFLPLFAMLTGVLKMLLIHLLPTFVQYLFMSQSPLVVVPFYGRLIRRLGLVILPEKWKLKLLMNVSKIFRCSIMFFLICSSVPWVLSQSAMIIVVLLTGLVHLVQRA